MNLPTLNTTIQTATPTTNSNRDKFVNLNIIDSEGRAYASFGVLRDNNAQTKIDDMEKLLALVGYKLSDGAPVREVAPMDFKKLGVA